jgi:uncharacterized repeat protein (TIGR03847 family)
VSEFFELASPERVTVGTVGPLGQRVFYLQARAASTLVTLKLEKQQVGALCQHLGRLLQDLARPGELPADDSLELEEFDEASFSVGALAVAYDATSDRVVLLAEEATGAEQDPEEDEVTTGSEARFALTREQAAALAIRGTALVDAGRPPCPLCGFPLDPRGHVCPRTNGHAPPIP